MFVYIVEVGQSVNINTPFKMVNREIEHLPENVIKNTSTYDNGWELTMTQYANRIEIISNKELGKDSNGSFIIRNCD